MSLIGLERLIILSLYIWGKRLNSVIKLSLVYLCVKASFFFPDMIALACFTLLIHWVFQYQLHVYNVLILPWHMHLKAFWIN